VSLLNAYRPFLCFRVALAYRIMIADVIGLLTEVSEVHTVHLPNKPRPTLTRHIILRDQKCVHSVLCFLACLFGGAQAVFSILMLF
jgi:hypothetical protein